MNIQAIVEGDGEVSAVPVLLRRLLRRGRCLYSWREPANKAHTRRSGSRKRRA